MKTHSRAIVFGISVLVVGMLHGFSATGYAKDEGPSPQKIQLQNMYQKYLTEEGYRPELDKDGDIMFKREGKTYTIAVSETDPTYFRLMFINFWSIESEAERAKVTTSMDLTNAKIKTVKVFTVRDNVWATSESFLGKPEDFKTIFSRTLSALSAGVSHFVETMRSTQKK